MSKQSDTMVDYIWRALNKQIDDLQSFTQKGIIRSEQAEVTQGVIACTLANVPPSPAGTQTDGTTMRWISNGRKPAEGAGTGTGVLAIYDPVSTNWVRTSDYSVVVI